MITLRLCLPDQPPVTLELPEREGFDGMDLLESLIVRLEGGDWKGRLHAPGRSGEGLCSPTPNQAPAALPRHATLEITPSGADRQVSGVRATSRDALHRLQASGRLGKQEMLVYGFVREGAANGLDYTRQEIAQGLNLGINAVTGRVFSLIHSHGLLRETERRTCRITRESVMAIAAVEAP